MKLNFVLNSSDACLDAPLSLDERNVLCFLLAKSHHITNHTIILLSRSGINGLSFDGTLGTKERIKAIQIMSGLRYFFRYGDFEYSATWFEYIKRYDDGLKIKFSVSAVDMINRIGRKRMIELLNKWGG